MVEQFRRVLNSKALKYRGIPLFGAEDEEESEEESEDESTDTPDSEDEDTETEESETESQFSAAYVKKLRNEAASYRKQYREAQKALDEASQRDLSEKEKAEKRAQAAEAKAQELEDKYRRTLVSKRVEDAARALKFIDPADAEALLDLNDLDTDEDELPTAKAVKAALSKLAERKTYLVTSAGSGDGGASGKNPPIDRTKEREQELLAKGRVAIRQ